MTAVSLTLLTTAVLLPAAPTVPPIVDPPTGELVPGRFVWGDLFSTDPAASTAYYTRLFGWTSRVLEADGKAYTLLSNGAQPIAGIVQGPPAPDNKPAARWIGYISVPDIRKAADAAVAGNGRLIIEPRLVPDRGMHAIVADNEGALFGLMTSSSGDPADYLAEPNEWIWITLFAREPRAVIPFYRAVAGLQEHDDYRTDDPDDFILSSGVYARAGLCKLGTGSKVDPAWVGFVRVNSVKELIERATALGGRAVAEPNTTAGGNVIAILADPLGGVFGVVEFVGEAETNS